MTDQLQGERVAFREWNIGPNLELLSTARGEEWPLEMVASCPANDGGLDMQVFQSWQSMRPVRQTLPQEIPDEIVDLPSHAPDMGCGCGLHAFYEPPSGDAYADENRSVVGAIVVSGRVLLGPTGVRAEKARIVLLASGNERQRVLAEGAARKLGVGCCALEDLVRLSLEYGQPVPDEEKPRVTESGFATGGVVPSAGWIRQGGFITLSSGVHMVGNTVRLAGSGVQISGNVTHGYEPPPKAKTKWPTYGTSAFWVVQAGGQALVNTLWLHSLVTWIFAGVALMLALIFAAWTFVRDAS